MAAGAGESGAYLVKLAEAVEARKEEFIRLLIAEQGKPTAQATMEVMGAIGGLRGLPGELRRDQCSPDGAKRNPR
jgi:acyl-CoA reductase-like NAD-dependent aldehyde dehydrogenase